MSRIYDCSDNSELLTGTRLARQAVAKGQLVVIPTDTVYGVAADAFSPAAVALLLEAKGRGRQSPPPVLIPSAATLDGLADNVPPQVRALAEEFWPGGLTIVLDAQPSLRWDLGDTQGTVAVRVPAHPVALELLAETGPVAVSSANLTGQPAATTAQGAHDQLGARVEVYLDGGTATAGQASTIIDATPLQRGTGGVRILRDGVVSAAQLREELGDDLEPSTEALS
jgi:tRNA threonylcarbamoyl adenosine modification protein (Sua5/YciO/YrdC/YwlC family)